MRILVTGTRGFVDAARVETALADYAGTLVVGDASGVDRIAARYWQGRGLPVEVHPTRTTEHGKQAGPLRNQAMVEAGADVCLAFPGVNAVESRDCVRKARAAGIEVITFRVPRGHRRR